VYKNQSSKQDFAISLLSSRIFFKRKVHRNPVSTGKGNPGYWKSFPRKNQNLEKKFRSFSAKMIKEKKGDKKNSKIRKNVRSPEWQSMDGSGFVSGWR